MTGSYPVITAVNLPWVVGQEQRSNTLEIRYGAKPGIGAWGQNFPYTVPHSVGMCAYSSRSIKVLSKLAMQSAKRHLEPLNRLNTSRDFDRQTDRWPSHWLRG